MRKILTARQRSVLRLLIRFVRVSAHPPCIREMGAEFGMGSLGGVTVHLEALERKGFIRRNSGSRGIKVLLPDAEPPSRRTVPVPILGTIAARTPFLAVENLEGKLIVP